MSAQAMKEALAVDVREAQGNAGLTCGATPAAAPITGRHHGHDHAAASLHPGGHHLLRVEGLNVSFRMYDPDEPFFRARRIERPVIRDLSVSVHAGEVMAVVGASGSGKTLLADAILGLYERNVRVSGRILFEGKLCGPRELADLRGHGVSLVPQSVNNLDPLMRVGEQIVGSCGGGPAGRRRRAARRERMLKLFAQYRLAPEVADKYPHELSGGMARRVLLACALLDDPRLIVADEPTPGLDLELAVRALDDLRFFADTGGGVLLITHDIELALRVADRIAVFRDGTVVEEAPAAAFEDPSRLRDPYTRALWHAMPGHGFDAVAFDDAGPFGAVSQREGGDGADAKLSRRPVKADHATMGGNA